MPANFNMSPDADALHDFSDAPQPARRTAVLTEPATATQAASLNYDFDVVEALPDAAQQAHIDALAALGQPTDTIHVMMRWRDQRTVAAIQSASPAVRQIFEDAGFGYEVSGRRIEPGSYDVSEGSYRHETVMLLTNRLAETDATQLDWGQFDIAAFFKSTAEANGIRTGTEPNTPIAQSGANKKRKMALLVMLGGIALVVVAAFAML